MGKVAKGQGNEKRRDRRLPVELSVRYQSLEGFYSDYSMNISQGGMFVSTQNPFPVGTRVTLKVILPAGELPLGIEGEVIWISEYDRKSRSHLIPGMGIQFCNLGEQEKGIIEAFIDREAQEKGIVL